MSIPIIGQGPEACPICGEAVKENQHTTEALGTRRDGVQVKLIVHEVCALKQILASQGQEIVTLKGLVGSMLSSLGGTARLHEGHIKQAAMVGSDFEVIKEEGGFFRVELRRVLSPTPA